MIRKLLVIAAAVAMPVTALAAVTVTAAPAGAVNKTYTTMSCSVTGSLTFAKPGLSYNGSIGGANTSHAKSAAIATGAGCGKITLTDPTGTVNTTKNTITSASTNCHTAPPPLPGACTLETATKFYAYDTASSFGSFTSAIVSSLGPTGINLVDNNNPVKGQVTLGGTTSFYGLSCGPGNFGILLSGLTDIGGLTYSLSLCIVADTGTSGPNTSGTTGAFVSDYLYASAGDNLITIATGIYGGASLLTFTKV